MELLNQTRALHRSRSILVKIKTNLVKILWFYPKLTTYWTLKGLLLTLLNLQTCKINQWTRQLLIWKQLSKKIEATKNGKIKDVYRWTSITFTPLKFKIWNKKCLIFLLTCWIFSKQLKVSISRSKRNTNNNTKTSTLRNMRQTIKSTFQWSRCCSNS